MKIHFLSAFIGQLTGAHVFEVSEQVGEWLVTNDYAAATEADATPFVMAAPPPAPDPIVVIAPEIPAETAPELVSAGSFVVIEESFDRAVDDAPAQDEAGDEDTPKRNRKSK